MSTRTNRPLFIAVLFLAALAGGGYYYWAHFMRGLSTTDDARLAATMVDVSPESAGRIAELEVSEGAHVQRGDVLFRLDDRDPEAAIALAEAQIPIAEAGVTASQAQLDKAHHGPRPQQIRGDRARVGKLKTQLRLAESELERVRMLNENGLATRQALDQASAEVELLEQSIDEAGEHLSSLQQGTRSEDVDAAGANVELARARLEAARARLEQAKLALERTVARAPSDGIVVKTWRDVGELVAPGTAVVTVLDPDTMHVDANIEETELDQVAVGDEVDVSLDAYPSMDLHGHVDAILRATRSEFSLMPSEGVSGAFIKVTQRVPIRVALDDLPDDDVRFAPGLSAVLTIHSATSAPGVAARAR